MMTKNGLPRRKRKRLFITWQLMIETTMKKVETMAWMATSKIGVVNIFLKEPKMTPYGDYFGEGMVATIGTVGAGKFP